MFLFIFFLLTSLSQLTVNTSTGPLLKGISIVIHFMYGSKGVVIIPMSSTGMDNVLIINSITFRNLNKNKWPGVITIWHKFISCSMKSVEVYI